MEPESSPPSAGWTPGASRPPAVPAPPTAWTPPMPAPPPRTPYVSLRGLDVTLRGLLGACAALAVLGAVFRVRELALIDDLRAGRFVRPATLEASDDRINALAGFSTLLFVVTGVVFVVWLWRATQNLRAFPNPPLRRGPGWAIGGWFVPILNLVVPKQMVDDAWRGATPGGAPRTWTSMHVPAVFGAWWALLILSWVVGFAAGIADIDALDLDGLRNYSTAMLVSEVLTLAAAACAIAVVAQISARQLAAATSIAPPAPFFSPDPPPSGSTLEHPPGV